MSQREADRTEKSGSTFRSFKYRNFRLFFIGQGISQVGNWLTLVAQALLAYKLGKSAFAVGVLAACQFLPVLLLGAYGGVVSDRTDRRKLEMVVQTVAMFQSVALAIVAGTNASLVWLDLTAVVGGVTMAFDNPARRTLFVELVDPEDVNNAVGLNSSLMTSSRIIGPAIASILIATIGFAGCFTFDAVSYFAVLIALWMMRPSEINGAPIVEKASGQIREGWDYVRRTPELWISLLMMAVVGTLAFNFQVVLPVFVERTFGDKAVLYAVLFAVMSVGSLAGALVAARHVAVDVRDVADREPLVRCGDARARGRPHAGVGVPVVARCRLHEHHVPHGVDGNRPDPGRARDARPGARTPGDRVPRHHADRRPDRRRPLRRVRRAHRTRRGRCVGAPGRRVRRRPRAEHDPPPRDRLTRFAARGPTNR